MALFPLVLDGVIVDLKTAVTPMCYPLTWAPDISAAYSETGYWVESCRNKRRVVIHGARCYSWSYSAAASTSKVSMA